MQEIWRILYNANVDVIINGHDHLYERFAKQDPDGRPDEANGIRQFTVGTGGVPLYSFGAIRPNSDVRASVWGVLVLFLNPAGYEWNFMPAGVPGVNFRDTGHRNLSLIRGGAPPPINEAGRRGACHSPRSAAQTRRGADPRRSPETS